jgi:hypothetical protein
LVRWLLLFLLLFAGPLAGQTKFKPEDWKLVTDRDEIKVYMAHDSSATIKTFRGVTVLPMEDFRSIGAAFDDYDFVASWLHMVSEIEGLERESEFDRHVYIKTRLPWPVSDRDAPLWVGLEQRDDHAVYIPFRDLKERLPEKDGFVRIPKMRGFFLFRPLEPGRVRLTFQVVLDPGGYVPNWLANMILRDIPYFSLKRLHRVINLDEYQGVEHGYYEIPPGWPGATRSPSEKGTDGSAVE